MQKLSKVNFVRVEQKFQSTRVGVHNDHDDDNDDDDDYDYDDDDDDSDDE